MKYVNFKGHHYGIYVSYRESYVYAVLVENKLKVCDLTVRCYKSSLALGHHSYAYVDIAAIEDCEELLNLFGVKLTGLTHKYCGKELHEFEFTNLVALHNREMKRDKLIPGMVDVSEQMSISTSIIYYIYRNKIKDEYHLVTTDGWNFRIEKKYMIKAVKEHNIPVYKSFRKEPYDVRL